MKTLTFCLSILFFASLSAYSVDAPGEIEKVKLSDAMEFSANGTKVKLPRISAGLRYKKVVFVKANVYVAQLFGSDPAKFKRSESEALSSLKEQKNLAMHLTFLRAVDAKTIEKAYKEGFKENGIKEDETGVKEFLAAAGAGGDGKDGSVIQIVAGRPSEGREHISYTGPNGKTAEIDGQIGLIEKVFSLFLGKPGDSGLESLKKDLTR